MKLEAVVFSLAFVVLVLIFVMFVMGADQNQRWNAWLQRCHNDQGTVQQTSAGLFSDQYECFKNGKIIDHEN